MESRLFTNFAKEEVEKILSFMKKKNFEKDTLIFKEGDEGDELFLIYKGEVEIFIERKDKRITLATLSVGDFFGEMGILRGDKRSASVLSKTYLETYSISRKDIEKFLDLSSRIAAKFFINISEVLAERIATTNREVENWFLINDALVENETFRNIYFKTHKR
uniref:Cyclic nucleotide-binding domain-containing protein n=1 Tax=candidate division WOR-3 bacterium TaxID=2052148 RepID=A0A7C3J5Z2_UNCW3